MKPCARCDRHVRVSEVVCPFCGATQHEVSATARSWAVGLAMLGAACGPAKEGSASGSASETTSETTSTSSSTDGTVTGIPTTSGGSDSESGTSTSTSTGGISSSSTECASCSDATEGGGFIYGAPDTGGTQGKECDPWVQDCPIGQKCAPFASGGNTPNGLHCVPVAESPAQAGEPCVVEGSGDEQTDNCDFALACWGDICVPQCTGTPDAPVCDDPATACVITNNEVLTLCLPTCDPLASNCPADEVCVQPPDSQHFFCVVDASDDGGQEFDECGPANSCDPGLACLDPALATECPPGAVGCCLKYCDLTNPTCAGADAECLPWFEPGMAPAGLEDVGKCGLPD
ncbi:hypothetical protein [Nannocystis pusilla]|uniref:Lipoprotein n=1 Tax=Nannocystis pusilla TaxID=889268 RepID=A0ABS7TPT4_9BACT|nr:hypothetical protein [Nannocystis pusilla]MBZ5710243.1 hypothetical protein [Nannocystis pusilla]